MTAKQKQKKGPNKGLFLDKVDRKIDQMRKHWFFGFLAFILLLLATSSQFWRQVYDDLIEKRIEKPVRGGFAVLMQTEDHGHGTLQVTCSDPKEIPPRDIDLAIEWQITNIGELPNNVAQYYIIAKSGTRILRFRSLNLQSAQYLIRRTNAGLEYTNISNKLFDARNSSKTLSPRETIGGWIFLTIESDNDHKFTIDQLQVILLDSTGTVHFIVPKPINAESFRQMRDVTIGPARRYYLDNKKQSTLRRVKSDSLVPRPASKGRRPARITLAHR